jgi:hypothetical protein
LRKKPKKSKRLLSKRRRERLIELKISRNLKE